MGGILEHKLTFTMRLEPLVCLVLGFTYIIFASTNSTDFSLC